MQKILLSILLCIITVSANDEWVYGSDIDAFTDKKKKYIIYNNKDHNIAMDSLGVFLIERKKYGKIYPYTDVLIRVDRNDIFHVGIETSVMARKYIGEKITDIKSTDKFIAFKFRNYTFQSLKVLHCEMSKGNILTIRYKDTNNINEDVVVPLTGVNKVLNQYYGKDGIPNCKK